EASLPERPSVITPAPALAPAPEAAGGGAEPASSPISSAEGEPASSSEGEPDVPRQPTGPGMKTWEGAPELAAEAVLSAPTSTPPPARPREAANPNQTQPGRATTPPQARRRERRIIAVAATFGILLGLGIVAKQRHRPADPPRSAALAATSSPIPPPAPKPAEAASSPPNDPAPPTAAPSADEDTAEPSSAASANGAGTPAAAGFRRHKLCKPEGAKCFSNDDCCDRACHHWICKANAVMHDPYGGPGD